MRTLICANCWINRSEQQNSLEIVIESPHDKKCLKAPIPDKKILLCSLGQVLGKSGRPAYVHEAVNTYCFPSVPVSTLDDRYL